MRPSLDQIAAEALLREATQGFESLGRSMAAAYDAWAAAGAAGQTLDWLGALLEQAGWWHGRLTSQLTGSALARQDHPDDFIG